MEIMFQNKREDMEAFYNYILNETPEGKGLGRQAFNSMQLRVILFVISLSSIYGGLTGKGGTAFLLALVFSILLTSALLFEARFKPYYYFGKQVLKRQEELLAQKDFQILQLQRTLTTDEKWLEIHSSEALHRWRWRQVNRIGITSNFIFIHVANCPVVYVPKRDFSSEENFVKFGEMLLELKEKNKSQPMGTE